MEFHYHLPIGAHGAVRILLIASCDWHSCCSGVRIVANVCVVGKTGPPGGAMGGDLVNIFKLLNIFFCILDGTTFKAFYIRA